MMNSTRKWRGRWIAAAERGYFEENSPAPYMRKTFECPELPNEAKIYLCGLGFHELYVNGVKAGDCELAPSPSQFDKHVHYIAYDVTKMLLKGRNAVTVLLGNGWYNCSTATVWHTEYSAWRDQVKMLCDIELNGICVVWSDLSWKTAPSPVVFNALRNGEHYDARLELPGFANPDYDDSFWQDVFQVSPPGGELVLEDMAPCRITEYYEPLTWHQLTGYWTIYDFGINLSGVCEITVTGPPGSEVVIEYAELINDNLDIQTEYFASFIKSGDFQQDRYILKGDGQPETWRARFSYHGFRYARVRRMNMRIKIENIKACFIHTDLKINGSIESSDNILNSLQRMTLQSYRSNFVGIPTDCPHREKNGWTGDALLSMETGAWNFNIQKECADYLRTVVDTQRPSGQLSAIAPSGGFGYNWWSGPAWDSILFEYPWRTYLFYGDTSLIKKYYPAMTCYLNYCEQMTNSNGLVNFGLGDWCHHDLNRIAPVALTSSAYYYYDLCLMKKFATILRKNKDAKAYSRQAAVLRDCFNTYYYHDNTYAGNEWTSIAAALYFKLADETNRYALAQRLVESVRNNLHKADFGILGAKWVPRVLADYGYAEDACKLFTQPEYPGWGNWVKQGETTLCEHWNRMHSRNHVMFGDVSAWMFQYLGGVMPSETAPGFRHFFVRPHFINELDFFTMTYNSGFGKIYSKWYRNANMIEFKISIPQGSTADIELPGISRYGVSGQQCFQIEYDRSFCALQNDYLEKIQIEIMK